MSLDPESHIEVPDANFGLYACDVLEPNLVSPLTHVDYVIWKPLRDRTEVNNVGGTCVHENRPLSLPMDI